MKATNLTSLLAALILIMSCSQQEEELKDEIACLKKTDLLMLSDALLPKERFIVVFKENVTSPTMIAESICKSFGITAGHIYQHVFKGFSAFIPEQIMSSLRNHPMIDYIEKDIILQADAQTVPTGIKRICTEMNNIAAIDGSDQDLDVDVAVLDTGIDKDHPDLYVEGGVRFYYSMFTDSNYDDDNGHGSHVAGIIGARDNNTGVVGVAPHCHLYAVKVLNSKGSGYISDIIKGLEWVTQRAETIEVINMSLGGAGLSTAYQTAISNCVKAGIVVVVSAGNKSCDVYGNDGIFGTSDDIIPAAYPEAAAISALTDSDGKSGGAGAPTSYGSDDSFASYSNFSRSIPDEIKHVDSPGRAIDLILPGTNILSTYKDGKYATMSGTSMASPHAAGLVALYIAKNGRAHNANEVYAIRQALINAGKYQDSAEGLSLQNDPDGNYEKLGWAATDGKPVNPAPVAGFSYTANNLTVTFTDQSTDNGSFSRSWNFGDGSVSSAQSPVHTYATAGSYAVSLTVTDEGGLTDTEIKTISVTAIVNPAPVAGFSYTANNLTVTFTDLSTDNGSFSRSWNFGDGSVSSAQSPVHTYAAAGSYAVSLTVTDEGGLTDTEIKTISVTAAPVQGNLVLKTTVTKYFGFLARANLSWTPTTAVVDIYRNGTKIASSVSDSYGDFLRSRGTYKYQIQDSSGNWSNIATVVY